MASKVLALVCLVSAAYSVPIYVEPGYSHAPAKQVSYSAPQYSAPASHYAVQAPQYAAPAPQYAAAASHYAAPASHYVAQAPQYAAPASHYADSAKGYHEEAYDPNPQYKFEYSVNDEHTGDIKSQQEELHDGIVQGSYSLVEADGSKRTVEYSADHEHGFNAVIHREHNTHPAPAAKYAPAPAHYAPASVSAPAHYAAPARAHYAAPAPAHYAAPAPVHYAAPAPAHYASAPAPVSAHYAPKHY